MKFIQSIILLTLLTSSAFAQNEPGDEYQVPVVEDIISCAMLDGFFTHKIYKRDGDYKGLLAFPVIDVPYTDEELRAKQLEFVEWGEREDEAKKKAIALASADGRFTLYREVEYESTPPPGDSRRVGVSMPVTSSNIMTSDQTRLDERVHFFDSIFPSIERADFISFDMGKLFLDFEDDECQITEIDGLFSAYCSTESISELNGVPIGRIEMHMGNQFVKLMAFEDNVDPEQDQRVIARTQNLVNASIVFHSRGKTYRSSFAYTPDENTRACSIEGRKLQKFID